MSYAIDDGVGDQITTGLAPQAARRTAQRMADERGASVFLYEDGDESEAEEIRPGMVEIVLDSPNGPLVEYGGHEASDVESAIPDGYIVDWSSALEISVSGTHVMRRRAMLVSDGLVTVETMPPQYRGSHMAAANWGVYPHNGAVRTRVTREDADAIVAADVDGYARIVE